MAMIVQGGFEAFAGATLGSLHHSTVDFLRQAPQTLSERLTTAGRQFVEASERLVGKVDLDSTLRVMEAMARQTAAFFQTDRIRPLSEIGELQNPPQTMRHLMMACPEIRTLYHNQLIDGYQGLYVDKEPGCVGEDHYDYRRVTEGVWLEDSTGENFVYNHYFDCEEGDALSHADQVAVMMTWDQLKAKINEGRDDPTSRWNAAL